jgi:hypothetical protein
MSVPFLPRTAQELVEAIEQGVLIESLIFDGKAELEGGARGNTRLAIDMAAMAVAGGLIAVGVAEEEADGARRLIPRPIPLQGLRRARQPGGSEPHRPTAPRDDEGTAGCCGRGCG